MAGGGREPAAFTLVEMLAVMAIIVALVGLAVPAVNALKTSGDVTTSAYDLSDALERGRAYAMANSTYVWLGLFEEDGSRDSMNPATSGKGRIVISTVYSKDGTCLYDPSGAVTGFPANTTLLGQYGKLLKIGYAHLTTLANGTGNPVHDGNFLGRPPAGNTSDGSFNACHLSDSLPATACQYPFSYPLGSSSAAQYTFTKMIQFSPRGEVRIDCVQALEPVVEIGLLHCRGAVPDATGNNAVAVQLAGITGNARIYRP